MSMSKYAYLSAAAVEEIDAAAGAIADIYIKAAKDGRGTGELLASETRDGAKYLDAATDVYAREAKRCNYKTDPDDMTHDFVDRVQARMDERRPPREPVGERSAGIRAMFADHAANGRGTRADYRRKEILAKGESMRDWVEARSGKPDYDLGEAWNALASGLVHDQWDGWRDIKGALSIGGEGGELVPSPLSGDVIDLMRSSTPLFQLGATTVPMTARTLDIARVTADPAASTWHAENGTITPDTSMTLDQVTFSAKVLPVIVKASMELAEDAPNLGQVVRQAIAGQIGVELTKAALAGDGTSNSLTGILNQTGVTTTDLGTNGAAADYDTVLDAIEAVELQNTLATGALFNPRTRNSLAKLKDTANNYLVPPPRFNDLPKMVTTAIPNTLDHGTETDATRFYVGNWAHLLVGIRHNLSIKVLDQRYADTGEIAFMAWLRADVQLAHGESFVAVIGVNN